MFLIKCMEFCEGSAVESLRPTAFIQSKLSVVETDVNLPFEALAEEVRNILRLRLQVVRISGLTIDFHRYGSGLCTEELVKGGRVTVVGT